jgi:hypothetical protein
MQEVLAACAQQMRAIEIVVGIYNRPASGSQHTVPRDERTRQAILLKQFQT